MRAESAAADDKDDDMPMVAMAMTVKRTVMASDDSKHDVELDKNDDYDGVMMIMMMCDDESGDFVGVPRRRRRR